MTAGLVRGIMGRRQDMSVTWSCGHHVRLKLRKGLSYHWHTGTAHLLPDDDPRERQRWLANQLPSSAGNARAVRLFGTQLLSIRIELDD